MRKLERRPSSKQVPALRSGSEQTPARVNLGVTGVSLPTRALLEFQMDQAQAQDAVYEALATVSLVQELAVVRANFSRLAWTSDQTLLLHSAAHDRGVYLRRPDLGRRLAADAKLLSPVPCTLVVVLADGLSALAVNRHAVPLLRELLSLLATDRRDWSLGPVCVVEQGRVAIGDEIGERLQAAMLLMLIGERPGLSAPDSLGAYLTWQPRVGRTDAERNCISNIRPEGLSYTEAAERIHACMMTAAQLQLTGVQLHRATSLEAPSPSLKLPLTSQ